MAASSDISEEASGNTVIDASDHEHEGILLHARRNTRITVGSLKELICICS